MTLKRLNAFVWFAVLGGSLAWVAQLAAGYQLGIARCSSPNERFAFSFHSWSVAFAVAAVVVALLSEGAAIFVFRATRDAERLPIKRVHFLATVAIAVNPLVLAISAMTAVGTSLLSLCHQS
ncbi:MAG: hypothetical protein ACTHM1_11635 [Solirubrobacteraceae bacterium]